MHPDHDPLAEFLRAMELTDTGARTTEDIFVGVNQPMPHGRVFGGQVLAQCLIAAHRTVAPRRPAHSLHGYFLRPGDPNAVTTFAVDRIHDGGTFSRRRVQAHQQGRPIFSMIASFQEPYIGIEHQSAPVDGLPGPDGLEGSNRVPVGTDRRADPTLRIVSPFEFRRVPDGDLQWISPESRPHSAVWIKSIGPLPDDPALHQASLAYASDYTVLESALAAHRLRERGVAVKAASLDHAMWWHRAGRADEWNLFVQRSPSSSGSRGLGEGLVYSRSGVLLASMAQEGMIRVVSG